jgi:hypothetical protein
MNKDEVLKLALKYVELTHLGDPDAFTLLDALREALAQPAQAPDIYPEEARDMGLEAVAYYTTPPAQPAQEPVARIAALEAALNEIASAGMSPSPEMSDDGKTAWHASQAWRFIGIAARAIELAPAPVGERCCYHDSDCAVHNMPAYPAGPCDCSLASLAQPAQENNT